jgi:hypothetical protein
MHNPKIVNWTESHLRIRFNYLRLLQRSPLPQHIVASRSCPAAPTCAANGHQSPSPLVRRHALMRRVHRPASGLLALSLIGSTAQPQHAGIKRLTSVFPRSSSRQNTALTHETGTIPWVRLTVQVKPEAVNDRPGKQILIVTAQRPRDNSDVAKQGVGCGITGSSADIEDRRSCVLRRSLRRKRSLG